MMQDAAKVYMRTHAVPREMQRRVQRWYDYAWLRWDDDWHLSPVTLFIWKISDVIDWLLMISCRGKTNGTGDVNSLEMLPDKLKTELAIHVNLEILKKVRLSNSSFVAKILSCNMWPVTCHSKPVTGHHLSRVYPRVPARPCPQNEGICVHSWWHDMPEGGGCQGDVHHCWWPARGHEVSDDVICTFDTAQCIARMAMIMME